VFKGGLRMLEEFKEQLLDDIHQAETPKDLLDVLETQASVLRDKL